MKLLKRNKYLFIGIVIFITIISVSCKVSTPNSQADKTNEIKEARSNKEITMENTVLNQLVAKQEITEVIYRYARGADRMDKELFLSVFHDDATVLYHNVYEGAAPGIADNIWETHKGMTNHSHQMTNILIQLDGLDDPQTATVETYAVVTLIFKPDENGVQHFLNLSVRYMDRMSKRDGRWAIDHREVVGDTVIMDGVVQNADPNSRRDREDPSYNYLP
jgi:uncharacterized protein YpmB